MNTNKPLTDRLTKEQIRELTTSIVKLAEFEKEVKLKYPPSKYSIVEPTPPPPPKKKSNKRRASKPLEEDMQKRNKYAKVCDFIGMNVKEALDKSFLVSMLPRTESISSLNLCDASSMASTSSNINSRDLNYSESDINLSSIELSMGRLFSLYKLLQSKGIVKKADKEEKPVNTTKSKKSRVYEEEYVVSNVLRMEWANNEPRYEIKWKGYVDKTWEPIQNIYDCQAFREFTANFLHKNKQLLEEVWNKLQASVVAEAMQPNLSETEALKIIEQFDYYVFQSYFFCLALFQKAEIGEKTKEYRLAYERVMDDMKYVEFYFRRLEQLQNIYGWLNEINEIDKSKNLRAENLIDFETPPINEFKYTNDVIPRGINIPDDPPVGCECAVDGGYCSLKSNCCPTAYDAKFAYTAEGRIRVPQGTPVFECNKRCLCSEKCQNRVVQKGRKQTLCIFKTANGRGWGVRTDRYIAKGAYICEYVGEIITSEESEKRGEIYDAEGRTYLFDLDFNDKDNPYTVDAAKFGNVSRFINHSCDPNLGVWAVWTDCLDLDLPKLCLFTLRSINENEELTFDYSNCMGRFGDDDDESVVGKSSLVTDDDSVTETTDEMNIDEQPSSHINESSVEVNGTNGLDAHPNVMDTIQSNNESAIETIVNQSNGTNDDIFVEASSLSIENPDIIAIDTDSDKENESFKSITNGEIPQVLFGSSIERVDPVSVEEVIMTVQTISSERSATIDETVSAETKETTDPEKRISPVKKPRAKDGFECRCGASNCRKIIFC